MKRNTAFLAVIALVALVPRLYAGKEFTAGPGETPVADRLLVRLRPGADINRVLAALAPQAVARFLTMHGNHYALTLPPGLQKQLSQALAAHPDVDFVEPDR